MVRMFTELGNRVPLHCTGLGHIQVADVPDRHEPGSGEIHYPHALAAIGTPCYQGYVGLEYNASTSSEASFSWLPEEHRRTTEVSDLYL